METELDYYSAKALLEWQVELGVTEAMLDKPVNRFDLPDKRKAPTKVAAKEQLVTKPPQVDPVAASKAAAQAAESLDELKTAMEIFPHCDLRKGARNLVFGDGQPQARLMILGEAPGRDEDREGRPFVGRAGQLLDRMFDAIGMSRTAPGVDAALYITNVLPWRPPQNRDPKPEEIAMMMPFVERHIELVDPDVLVLMGNIACQATLGRRGITRLRGQWTTAFGKPVLPMFHPAYLLRSPAKKRETWNDILALKHRLQGGQ